MTSDGNKFYDFPQTQLIKYGAAMSFAFKEELNELVIFTTVPISPVNNGGAG